MVRRAADRRFRDLYCLANYRFVNNDDLVPHLPFRWCYKHVGELRLLDEEGNFIEEKEAWQVKKRSLAGKAKQVQQAHRHAGEVLHALLDFDWLADHHLDKYLSAIEEALLRVPQRIPLERLGANLRRFLAPPQRLDSGSSAVPPPHLKRRGRQSSAISQRDLIEAFADQPREP